MPSPMWVILIQSTEDLNRTKERERKNSFSLISFELRHCSFPLFRLKLKNQLFLVLKSISLLSGIYGICSFDSQAFGLGLKLYHQLSGSPDCQLLILVLLSLHNHVRQFLI